MSASRALPEPGEPPTTGARSPRRTSARAKRGEAGCRRRPDRRCRQIGREVFHGTPNTLADVRNASRKRTAKRGGSCARRARPSPAAHAPLAAAVQPLWRRGGRRGLRPPSLLRIHGRAPRARRPGSLRRHALEDPPEAARSRMPRSPRRRAPLETRRAREIRRPARPGRGGTGTPATRPLSAWTPEAARCTRSGLPPPTSTTSSSPALSCGGTARFATPTRDARARETRPELPAASPA